MAPTMVVGVYLAYLLGSLPSAYLAGRWLRGLDLREAGDGNLGAANAYRVLGPRAGLLVGLVDAAKGALTVLGARELGLGQAASLLMGAAAVAGHNWPFYLGFRGGRGATTTFGVFLVLLPRETLLLGLAALLALLRTRDMIKASAVLFAPLPFLAWGLGQPLSLVAYAAALPSLVGFTHYLTAGRRAEPVGAGRGAGR